MRNVIAALRIAAILLLALPLAAEEGFTPLFNGKDLDGWLLVYRPGTTKGYLIEDGVLICPADGGGDLLTVRQYSDFILRFEFRTEPAGNNGIIIRAPIEGRPSYDGMEIQILDHNNEKYQGWLQPWQRHGSVYGIAPATADALKPAGEWNSEEIVARGPHIVVTLNGTVINDADLSKVSDPKVIAEHPGMRRTKGHIGFHGHSSHVEFRNIRIRELTGSD